LEQKKTIPALVLGKVEWSFSDYGLHIPHALYPAASASSLVLKVAVTSLDQRVPPALIVRKIVGIDALDFIVGSGGDTNTMINHQLRECVTINQHDLAVNA
jgi:hypothetical protein